METEQYCAMVDSSAVVTMSNNLLESRYHLTLPEFKLFALAVSQIDPASENFVPMVIPVSSVAAIYGLTRDYLYNELEQLADSLMTRKFSIRDANGEWKKFNFVSYTEYRRGGLFVIKFSNDIRPYLMDLFHGNFTRWTLQQIASLQSIYAVRLYLALRQYARVGVRSFRIDSQHASKNILLQDVLGYSGSTYEKYGAVKQRILLPALQQLAKTDVQLAPGNAALTEIKVGRRVVEIRLNFHFAGAELATLDKPKSEIVLARLKDLGVYDALARKFTASHSQDYLLAQINYVSSRFGNHANRAGCLVNAIKEDLAQHAATVQSVSSAQTPVRSTSETSKRARVAVDDYNALRAKAGNMSPSQQRYFDDFIVAKCNPVLTDLFYRIGWKSRDIQRSFASFLGE